MINKSTQQSLALMLGICAVSVSAAADAAPSVCAVDTKEYSAQVSKERVTQKYCSSLLMARITVEETEAIKGRLEAEEWTSANKDRQADLLAKGMRSLAERNFCIETAQKISASYRQRFNEEPKCRWPSAK